MRCLWCKESGQLVKGYCFECHKMRVIEDMGSQIQYAEYEALTKDIDDLHCLGWVLRDTLCLFGSCTTIRH